jgi:hypothetical protein
MIVLDEQIGGPSIAEPIAAWYAGRVIPISALRPRTAINDDSIAMLLRGVPFPTFVTINIADFWRVIPADSRYAVVCMDLTAQQVLEIPDRLRRLLRIPTFKTKASRMGKVIRLRPTRIEYYEADGRVHVLAWQE